MELARLLRRLFYRWTPTGSEIEYPTDIPDPAPEIVCDTVQITVPPALPIWFRLSATRVSGTTYTPNSHVVDLFSYSVPTIVITSTAFFSSVGTLHRLGIRGTNQFGQASQQNNSFSYYQPGTAYLTPGSTQQPRRDLLIGSDRIINPTINAPCPTWRIAGGNCPPNSKDCGNCCLDCAALNTAINGLTSAVLPYSSWRPR